jgi:hypothetical protein
MILPYLGLYWSVWPHLLLDICLFVSYVSIYLLGTPGERLVLALFWWFCTVSCARELPKSWFCRILACTGPFDPIFCLIPVCLCPACRLICLGCRGSGSFCFGWWFCIVSCARELRKSWFCHISACNGPFDPIFCLISVCLCPVCRFICIDLQ